MSIFRNQMFAAAAVAGLLSAGVMAAPAKAQQQQNETPSANQQQQMQQQTNVSDRQLEEFALAHAAVQNIHDQYQGQAATVETQEELLSLQQRANEDMVQAIEQTDLTLPEYNQIATAIQFDPEVRDRFLQMAQ